MQKIFYLVTEAHAYTIEMFLVHAKHRVAQCIERVTYKDWLAISAESIPDGIYIFSDIERMSYGLVVRALQRWNQLVARGTRCHLLNHPVYSMRRYELLRMLHERGQNDFNAYLLEEFRAPHRWPVFLRERHEHKIHSEGQLLHSTAELETRLRESKNEGYSSKEKLVVEFLDTADREGIYRKYAAFCVGGKILPRHVFFGTSWILRLAANDTNEEHLEEEARYLETNPHAMQIAAVFAQARIDYGRIDYSMLGERMQVWEINTNPNVLAHDFTEDAKRLAVNHGFVDRLGDAFESLLIK